MIIFYFVVLFFSSYFAAAVNSPKKKITLEVFWGVFGSADFWPLLGYALRARWAFSSTTKAGFKKLYQAAQTNPVHPPTHKHTNTHTRLLRALDLAAILWDFSTSTDKQEHLGHVGRQINTGESRRNYL